MKKMYFDIAGNPIPDLLPLLLKIASPDHVMYGCDYPFTPPEMCKHGLEQLIKTNPLSKCGKFV